MDGVQASPPKRAGRRALHVTYHRLRAVAAQRACGGRGDASPSRWRRERVESTATLARYARPHSRCSLWARRRSPPPRRRGGRSGSMSGGVTRWRSASVPPIPPRSVMWVSSPRRCRAGGGGKWTGGATCPCRSTRPAPASHGSSFRTRCRRSWAGGLVVSTYHKPWQGAALEAEWDDLLLGTASGSAPPQKLLRPRRPDGP